jgi:hypothetical protein
MKSCLGAGFGGSLIFGTAIIGEWFARQCEMAAFKNANSRLAHAPAFRWAMYCRMEAAEISVTRFVPHHFAKFLRSY